MGGLGLRQASASALPAFVGSRNSTRELALHLLGADPDDHVESDYFPSGEETQAREQLHLILPDLLHLASQRSIQRVLDSLSFTSLKASLCLRDQARLNTIASPHAGAWLRALPNPLLGLAMPQHGTQWYHQRSGFLQPDSTTLCEALVLQLKVGHR